MLALLVQQFGQHLGLHLSLALRLYAGTTLGPVETLAHVHAAAAAATDEVSPELLLAVALVESRFNPYWVSRVENHKRRTSRYTSTKPPKNLDRRSYLYCGIMQTRAATWEACLAQRDLATAYRTGAAELTSWLHDKRVRGDISRALAGYGCGNHGVRTGKCNRYPSRVLYQANRLAGTRRITAHSRTRS